MLPGGVPVARKINRNKLRQWVGQLLPSEKARSLSQQLQQRANRKMAFLPRKTMDKQQMKRKKKN